MFVQNFIYKNQSADLESKGIWYQRKEADSSVGEESGSNTGDTGSAGLIPGLGRSPGEGNGSPLQYSCLGNPVDRGAGWATCQRVTKNQMRLIS